MVMRVVYLVVFEIREVLRAGFATVVGRFEMDHYMFLKVDVLGEGLVTARVVALEGLIIKVHIHVI